jgi:iron complex outermembrane recepter protein
MTKLSMPKPCKLALAIASLTAAGLPATLHAEEGFTLEEIVVTAQKRAESLQDVPISVSALSGDKIADAGIQRFEDAATYVPNFTITKEAIGDKISIRGIASGNNAGFEQSVGTFVDGIYRGRSVQSRFAFLDIGMLEVLRGPQGTLFGKNTVAGALNITSAKPTEDLEGQIKARYNANLDETEFTGYVSGALSDTVRGRFAFMQREMDEGWVKNEAYDQDGHETDEWAGRATLEWDVSGDTLVTFKYEHGDWEQDGATFEIGVAGPLAAIGIPGNANGKTTMGQVGSAIGPGDPILDFGSSYLFEGDLDEYSLTVDHQIEGATITAIAGYSEYEFVRKTDADYSPLSIANFMDDEEFEQTSLELRIVSDTGGSIEYIAGLYWQDSDLVTDGLSQISVPDVYTLSAAGCGMGATPNPGAATSASQASACNQQASVDGLGGPGVLTGVGRYAKMEQNTETWAAFTQITWHIQEDLRSTLGLRYTDEEKQAEQSVAAVDFAKNNRTVLATGGQAIASQAFLEFSPHDYSGADELKRSEQSFTWSLNIQYDLTEDMMTYASASTGYKAGGFNSFYMGTGFDVTGPTPGTHNPDDTEFEEEEVITYEIGAKMTLLDGAAELNVAYFYTEYDDLQVSLFSGNTTFEVQNAAEATTQGIEIDGRWQASENLLLSGSMGWIDFEYKSFENQACTADQFVAYREAVYQATGGAGSGNFQSTNADCANEGTNDLSGKESAFSPEYSATLSADYTQALGDFTVDYGVDIIWRDEMAVQDDLDPYLVSDAITKVNAIIRLTPADENWEVALIGNNITNETNELLAGNDMPLLTGARQVTTSPGATYSISGTLKF